MKKRWIIWEVLIVAVVIAVAVAIVVFTGDSGDKNGNHILSPASTLPLKSTTSVPPYLAQDKIAGANLNVALVAAKTLFSDNQDYTTATPDQLNAAEPSLRFVAGNDASTGPKTISSHPVSSQVIVLVAKSRTGDCLAVRDHADNGGGTQYAPVTSGKCTAENAAQTVDWTDATTSSNS